MSQPTYPSTISSIELPSTSSVNNITNLNSLYARELDNIIKNNTTDLPDLPEFDKSPSESPENYNFMNAINKSAEHDSKTTLDISNDDNYNLIIQQNTMYILGSIACASLLIASLIIGKKE